MIKIFFFLLSLLYAAFSQPVEAQIEPQILSSNNWSYFSNNTGWTVSSYSGDKINLEIPAEINDIPVTQLGAELFMNNTRLESVQIPDSVTTIGKNAFFGCTSLKEVKISEQLKAIPEGCFRYCLSLEHIEFPYILTSIGKNAFSDCLSLREISIPPNVTTIGETAFAYCENLASINVPRKLTTVNANAFLDTIWFNEQTDEFVFIGRGILLKYNGEESNVEVPYGTVSISNAFQGNLRIESVILPQTVLRITQNAFRDAANLKTINIPDFATTIGESAFQGCRSLTEINLPSTVTSLGNSSFRYCDHLTKLVIPEKIKTLSSRVVGDCPNLVSLKIPETVTTINQNAFVGSNNIQIKIIPGSPAEEILKELEVQYVYYQASTEEYSYRINGTEIEIARYNGVNKFIEIPAQIGGLPVTSIGDAAFQDNEFIRSVSIPFTVKSIGDYAFSNMPNLENIHFSFGLENVGSHVFSGSDALLEINIPQGVRSVGKDIIDVSAMTKICAVPESTAERVFLENGLWVYPPESCTAETVPTDKWIVENLFIEEISDSSEPENSSSRPVSVQAENINLVRIPNGIQAVTKGMIPDTNYPLILFVPSEVSSIDPSILEGKTVTIVGNKGSYAERFSIDNNLNFIVQVVSETGTIFSNF